MLELIKKSLLLGLGAITVTKEKVEEIVDELIKKGELAKDERSKAIQDLLNKGKEQEKILSAKISEEVQKAINKIGLATKDDLAKLEKKIQNLKKE